MTLFEILVAFWEDVYRKNPMMPKQTKGGGVAYTNTGDPLIDKWERELAMGLTPDLLEGLSPEQRREEQAAIDQMKRAKTPKTDIDSLEGFEENYA